jgi:hypothetical protein
MHGWRGKASGRIGRHVRVRSRSASRPDPRRRPNLQLHAPLPSSPAAALVLARGSPCRAPCSMPLVFLSPSASLDQPAAGRSARLPVGALLGHRAGRGYQVGHAIDHDQAGLFQSLTKEVRVSTCAQCALLGSPSVPRQEYTTLE